MWVESGEQRVTTGEASFLSMGHGQGHRAGPVPEQPRGPGHALVSSPVVEAARRNKEAELARAAELAAEAVASGLDADEVLGAAGVRPLRQLRPVPPLPSRASTDISPIRPARGPVYDPYSARRRQTPQWLVRYTAGLVAWDLVAAAAGALLSVILTPNPFSAWAPTLGVVAAWPLFVALMGGYAERPGSARARTSTAGWPWPGCSPPPSCPSAPWCSPSRPSWGSSRAPYLSGRSRP